MHGLKACLRLSLALVGPLTEPCGAGLAAFAGGHIGNPSSFREACQGSGLSVERGDCAQYPQLP